MSETAKKSSLVGDDQGFGDCLRWFVAGLTLGFLGAVMGLSYLGLADIGQIAPAQDSVYSEVNRPSTSTEVEVQSRYVPVQDRAVIWNLAVTKGRVNPATQFDR